MSIEKRPYVGTWKLNGQQLVQHTPDALVYVNGDTSVPGCPKCSGKIDLQKFITEVSVDAGTEPGSASATFSLSIPLHHTDSFARDAKFILRPGLEVHIYMRGYFPVKGLYSNLAEGKVQNVLDGSASVGATKLVENTDKGGTATKPVRPNGEFYSPEDLLRKKTSTKKETFGQRFPVTDRIRKNVAKVSGMMMTLHQYLEQQGYTGVDIVATGNGGYTLDGHVASSPHHNGSGVDMLVTTTVNGVKTPIPQNVTWRAIRKLRESGHLPSGTGQGMYLEKGQKPSEDPKWGATDTPHMDHSHNTKVGGQWIWVGDGQKNSVHGALKKQWLAALQEGVDKLPTPNGTVATWKQNLDGDYPEAPPVDTAFKAPDGTAAEATSKDTPLPQGNFGPSLLEEMGLAGMGIENTLAYPYYHVFHGVMTEVSHSYSGGVSNISINCSSMLHFWQYHNMSTNASVFGARPNNSKNKMSLVGNNFTGMHPYAIMYSLHYDMSGAAGGVGWALASKSNQRAVTQSGESLFSLNVRYWETRFRRGTKLRMHGATGELFSTMSAAWLSRKSSGALSSALRSRYNSPKSFKTSDVGREMVALGLYSGPEVRNAIDATRFAAQSRPDPNNSSKFEINILEMQAFVSNIGDWGQINLFESTYESKLDIANKVCDITGFEFFQDVDGDFVFKPPMWNLDTSSSRVYRIEDIDLINITFSEKEPQVTYMTVKGSHFKNLLGTGMENEWGVRGQYIDYRLVAQFGWRPGSYETNYFNDPKSMFFAAVNRMDTMNIGVNSASVTIPVRPELRPGYPVYIPYLDCFYYCNSFAHSHSVGGQCTTSLQLVGKRAKFYAPGSTSADRSGISAIKLGDTKLPERPLGVLDASGKPKLSGFPNVVMALDPTAINPLFFVVGTDIENIGDARVVKYLLKEAVELGIILQDDDLPDGSQAKTYTMFQTTQKAVGSQEGASTEVRFYFDEKDLNPVETAGKDPNIMYAAIKYRDLQKELAEKAESSTADQIEEQRAINAIYSQIAEINRDPALGQNGPKTDNLVKQKAALNEKALGLIKKKEASDQIARDELTALEQSWRDPGKNSGVSLLLDILEQTSEKYRAKTNFQNRGDLSNTINLLDMLSDKKATFSNGQQPGQYRYYSSSHPDPKEQGPPSARYDERKHVITDALPLTILPRDDGPVPTVMMYQQYPTSPFPGAAIPEAELKPGQPEAGIRVLTGNPKKPGGEVLAASEITEVMFTVQDVSVVKKVTTEVKRSTVSGMGSKVAAKIAEIIAPQGSLEGSQPISDAFRTAWVDLQSRMRAGLASAFAVPTTAITWPPLSSIVLGFPQKITVGKNTLETTRPIGDYKYAGSNGDQSLGVTVSKNPQAYLLGQAGQQLALHADRAVNQALVSVQRSAKTTGDSAYEQAVVDAFIQGFNIGVPSAASLKGSRTLNVAKKETTFSPVFPVSDAQGYHVIGSYRYGRGVSIDPDGVFAQLHKHDIFSMLDKNLVDQILRLYVQGRWQDIQIPKTEEITLGNGKKKIVPITRPPSSPEEASKYLNDEALRQLRAANLSDKQILDYSQAMTKGTPPGQLDFSLANFFVNNKDATQKIPVINAAYSLADLNFQQAGQVCACKAAEANTLLTAFGQAQFVSLAQAGEPAQEGFGSDPADAATRWVATQADLAATTWEMQQQALRGQVLDRGGSHVVPQFLNTFGIDTPGVTRTSSTERAIAEGKTNAEKVLMEKANADTRMDNLGRTWQNDKTVGNSEDDQ